MILRKDVVTAARSLVGTPFRHQGRFGGVDNAVDCIGLVWQVAKMVGYEAVIPANYSSTPSGSLLMRECDEKLVKQDRTELADGDIVVLWGMEQNAAQHFGIVWYDAPRFVIVHALSRNRQVVEHGFDRGWKKRLLAIYNYPDMEPA